MKNEELGTGVHPGFVRPEAYTTFVALFMNENTKLCIT
jgi:hypothetical protein